MKKLCFAVSVLLVFLLCSCSSLMKSSKETEEIIITDSWKTYRSLDEALSKIQFSIKLPQNAGEWKTSEFRVFSDNLIQVIYSDGKRDGFYVSKSITDDGIEGDWNIYSFSESRVIGCAYVTVKSSSANTVRAGEWMYEGHSYYLFFNEEQPLSVFERIITEIINLNS